MSCRFDFWRLVQFRLRTFLAATLLISLWISTEARTIQYRRDGLWDAQAAGATVSTFNDPPYDSIYKQHPPEIPFWRRWMGDVEVADIRIDDNDALARRLRDLFPEALVGPDRIAVCGTCQMLLEEEVAEEITNNTTESLASDAARAARAAELPQYEPPAKDWVTTPAVKNKDR